MSQLPLEITPQDVQRRREAGEAIRFIDVRLPEEHQLANIAGAELIPMQEIPTRLQELDGAAEAATLVFFCHHGMRSLQVANWLRQHGVEATQSMAGGIDRWSLEIDPGVPRYF